jgi:hypothetical protein
MLGMTQSSRSRTMAGTLIAVFCVLLVMLSGTIQVAHAHESGHLAHSDCSLCTTAHLVSLAVVPAVILIAIGHGAQIVALLTPVSPRTLSVFRLFTRPPPVAAAAS